MQIMDINYEDEGYEDPRLIEQLTQKVFKARDEFFEFVSKFDGTTDSYGEALKSDHNQTKGFESLWTYFDWWLLGLQNGVSSHDHLWLDPRAEDALWGQFVRLVPTIYLLVVEKYDSDPSLLDYLHEDPKTGKVTRVERRVTTKLPRTWITEAVLLPPDPTNEQWEQAGVIELLTGCGQNWPAPHYGKHVPNGEHKRL
ncbi:hypothetical protein [Nocardia wallacei]|uniref:hypothetical protein n=1 Tax=Nocardia wallacei TaxID=480035 RepID=UPI0024553E0C|nr:hypothetical protein [Nocardia wallacei]